MKILSYILTFFAGGIVTLIAHCCLILGKREDESIENYNRIDKS